MNDSNKSNSNSFGSTDSNHANNNPQSAASTDEKGKSFKALGRFNPITPPSQEEQPLQASSNEGGPFGQIPQGVQPNSYEQPSGYSFPPNGQPPVEPSGKLKHTGLGITSFIFSMVAGLVIVVGIIVMISGIMSLDMNTLEQLNDPAYIESYLTNGDASLPTELISMIIGVFIMMSSLFFAFIGSIFGLISLFIKNRRKIFGILGTIFNGVLLVGGFIFIVVSFAMSGL